MAHSSRYHRRRSMGPVRLTGVFKINIAGRMGGSRVTIQNMKLHKLTEKNVILIRALPGAYKEISYHDQIQQLKLVNNKERKSVTMANVKLFDQTGKEAGEVVLNDSVWYRTK